MSYETASSMIKRYIAGGNAQGVVFIWQLQQRLKHCNVDELKIIISTLEAQYARLWRQRKKAGDERIRDSLDERHSIIYDLLLESRASYRRQLGHVKAVKEGVAE